MKRRDALKTLMMASGSMLALPNWAIGWKAEDIASMNTTFTDYEVNIITSIVDIIIPSNGTIGGLSVGVDQFLVGLISQCYEDKFKGEIRANLHQLDSNAKGEYGKSFSECDKNNQKELFLTMGTNENEDDVSPNGNEDDETFFKFIKSETIRGFETSKEVMVNYHGFILMPGFYNGNVDVEA